MDSLLRAVGATTTEDETGSWVAVDDDGQTSVRGPSAVGNVVIWNSDVFVSLGLGTLVGCSINLDLLADDIAQAGLARRQLSDRSSAPT